LVVGWGKTNKNLVLILWNLVVIFWGM